MTQSASRRAFIAATGMAAAHVWVPGTARGYSAAEMREMEETIGVSKWELATPALELTLTDAQDRPVMRRVLLPAELGDMPAMAAAAELAVKLPIAVVPGAASEKIAGYRLLAFYP